jgi:type I restriction-modification system DNA methylase subunit
MQHCFLATIEKIIEIIDVEKRAITNRELIEICAEDTDFFITDPHFGHEIAETALNLLIARKYAKDLLSSKEPSAICSEVLHPLQERVPTQTWRSAAQVTYQQFSTPAPIAYLAAYLMNLSESDTVLEPSCGTGNLAVWAKGSGATIVTNEIDPRRRQLAGLIGLAPTGYDAEFIDDFLPESISPNVLLMNPPFSSSGGRVDRNRNKFGFRHVESALRRLSDGGRFAVILGEGGLPLSASGRRFWDSMSSDIQVTRSISLPGREYYRNGTTVGISLVLGNKSSGNEPQDDILRDRHQNFRCVEEVFETIRSERK